MNKLTQPASVADDTVDHVGLPIHVLQTSAGVKIEAILHPDTFQLTCRWSPSPPYSHRKLKRIWREYIPWRNEIMEAAARHARRRVMVATPGMNGEMTLAVFGEERADA